MTRTALACLLLTVAPLAAAPVPKALKNKGVDLTALHALIARQAVAKEWSEDDAAGLKKAIHALLDRTAEATGGEAWKLPLELDFAKVTIAKGPIEITKPGVYLIDGDVTELETEECVVLATGAVKCGCIEDSVVIAKEVQTAVLRNSLVLAAESVTASHLIGHPKQPGQECFVLAGKRIQAKQVFGGTFHVISADPKGKPPVSATRVERDATLLALPSAREVGDNRFKTVELKTAIAK
jgi:hypothetical protein